MNKISGNILPDNIHDIPGHVYVIPLYNIHGAIGMIYLAMYRVSHKKVYLFKTSISQAPNIPQKKFSTRNESMDILFQKHKFKIF